jgi:hypothetical protein
MPLTHDAISTPELGQKIYFRINGSLSGSHLTSLKIGLSKTTWGRIPLPLHLSFMGAPNCYWRTDSLIEVVLTAVNGKAAIPATLPYDKSLINVQVHSQYLTAEPGANAAGLTATNGITTKIGGQK